MLWRVKLSSFQEPLLLGTCHFSDREDAFIRPEDSRCLTSAGHQRLVFLDAILSALAHAGLEVAFGTVDAL